MKIIDVREWVRFKSNLINWIFFRFRIWFIVNVDVLGRFYIWINLFGKWLICFFFYLIIFEGLIIVLYIGKNILILNFDLFNLREREKERKGDLFGLDRYIKGNILKVINKRWNKLISVG